MWCKPPTHYFAYSGVENEDIPPAFIPTRTYSLPLRGTLIISKNIASQEALLTNLCLDAWHVIHSKCFFINDILGSSRYLYMCMYNYFHRETVSLQRNTKIVHRTTSLFFGQFRIGSNASTAIRRPGLLRNPHVESMLVNKYFSTRPFIGWQHSHVRKSLITNTDVIIGRS